MPNDETPMSATDGALPGWIDRLTRAASVAELRDDLARRWPDFMPQRLRRLAILGFAETGRRLAGLCAAHGIEIAAIADDDPARRAGAVVAVADLAGLDPETPVVIASHRVLKATDRLRGMGLRTVAPFALLQILDPERFQPHMFHDGWLEDLFENRDRHVALAGLLADDVSRRVLDAAIG